MPSASSLAPTPAQARGHTRRSQEKVGQLYTVQINMEYTAIMTRLAPPIALTIAGSDSGGGAGIQADLRSFAALGVHGTSALTAITAQNTRGVQAVHVLPEAMIRAQIDSLYSDMTIAAVKTGMLADASTVNTVTERLQHWKASNLVVDPVMVASSGDRLLSSDAMDALRKRLIPLAAILTPNVPEAEWLLDRRISDRAGQLDAARRLLDLGCCAVLLKGGHLAGERLHDLLLTRNQKVWFSHQRLPVEGHGTGCTLAAAISAGLAKGEDSIDACRRAMRYLQTALKNAYRPGKGEVSVLAHSASLRKRSAG